MRKLLSITICSVMLACSGIAQAANETTLLAPFADKLATRLQQVSYFIGVNGSDGVKSRAPVETATGQAFSRAQRAGSSDDTSNQAMLLGGLMIMGVIIKRRYGKGSD